MPGPAVLRRLAAPVLMPLLALGLALGALSGCQGDAPYAHGRPPPAPVVVADGSPERLRLNAEVFEAAWTLVRDHYYDRDLRGLDWRAIGAEFRGRAEAAADEQALYRVLNEMLARFDDRHVTAVSPHARQRSAARADGAPVPGYGFNARRVGDGWIVHRVWPGSPAERAGVQIGWTFVSVNGRPFGPEFVPAAGRVDTALFLDDHGRPVELQLTAEVRPPPPPREARRLDGRALYLRFDSFDERTIPWLSAQLHAARADPPPAVILDLRDNDGGSLTVVGQVIGRFFDREQDYAVLSGRFVNRRYVAEPADEAWTGPVAVLVSGGSASGSELLAATFQETGRGPVVGERTFGAVIASRAFNLPDGGELNVSIRNLHTARGTWLEKRGVTPDLEVAPTLAQRRAGEDPVLAAALARLGLAPAG